MIKFLNSRLIRVIVYFILLMSVYLFVDSFGIEVDNTKPFSWWKDKWNIIISIATFITAFYIGLVEILKDWEDNLPKKLTVTYKLKNEVSQKWEVVIKCEKVNLISEGDIRNWGQQLGWQINTEKLKFYPNMDNGGEKPYPYYDTKYYRLYNLVMYLSEKPKIYLKNEKEFTRNYLLWRVEENEDGQPNLVWQSRTSSERSKFEYNY